MSISHIAMVCDLLPSGTVTLKALLPSFWNRYFTHMRSILMFVRLCMYSCISFSVTEMLILLRNILSTFGAGGMPGSLGALVEGEASCCWGGSV